MVQQLTSSVTVIVKKIMDILYLSQSKAIQEVIICCKQEITYGIQSSSVHLGLIKSDILIWCCLVTFPLVKAL